MPWELDDFTPPDAWDHPAFRLRRLTVAVNEADHAAWTGSLAHIRATPGFEDAAWPRPMDLAQNAADLERHDEDFAAGRGFTWSVLPPDTDEVIGCVYVYPRGEGGPPELRSWVTAARADLDAVVHDAVAAWIRATWPVARVATHPR